MNPLRSPALTKPSATRKPRLGFGRQKLKALVESETADAFALHAHESSSF
jgi:hypothetical protein